MADHQRLDVTAVLAVLGLGWALGTPCLLYGSMIVAAPFFGELPTAAEEQQARHLLYGALGCGFLLPVVGIVVARLAGRPGAARFFAVALGLSLTGLGFLLSA